MGDTTIKPKVANIRLREGKEPITISGVAYTGDSNNPLRFPTKTRQIAGWNSAEAKEIVTEYGDRYELLNQEGGN